MRNIEGEFNIKIERLKELCTAKKEERGNESRREFRNEMR